MKGEMGATLPGSICLLWGGLQAFDRAAVGYAPDYRGVKGWQVMPNHILRIYPGRSEGLRKGE